MKIAVDCRYLGKSGIGRVCRGIIDNLDYSAHEYYLVGDKEKLSGYSATIIEDYTEPYSKSGLFGFNKRVNELCDVLITPNFLIPFGVKIPVHAVMHDLIFLDMKITTKNVVDRFIKKFLLKRCIKKAKTVACVSEFTKSRARHFYKKLADKCYVTYNGLSDDMLLAPFKAEEKVKGKLIYVGNIKVHKGLKTLLEAKKLLPSDYKLRVLGEKDAFLMKMKEGELDFSDVEFSGRVDDETLRKEIASSEFLIQPSLYEGFGLPPLEALYLGTKPIVSDIDVFKEVYEGFDVDYFKVCDANSLASAILNANPDVENQREKITAKYNYKLFAEKLIKTVEEKA